MAERTNLYKSDFFEIWIEDGIMIGILKNDSILTIDKARQMVEVRLRIFGENTMPLLADISRAMGADEESRRYLSKGEGIRNISAGALLIESPLSRFLGNIFVSINRPAIPTKLFTDRIKAIEWLRRYKQL